MKIGVISDTHDKLRPEAMDALRGSDLILHAGDIGSAVVLDGLRTIAPVVAVRGNNDKGSWADDLALTEVVAAEGASIYMLHDLAELDLDPTAARIHVVVSGHSHQPVLETRRGVTYLNPGSAGPRRFKLPIAVGRLEINGETVTAELVYLVPGDG